MSDTPPASSPSYVLPQSSTAPSAIANALIIALLLGNMLNILLFITFCLQSITYWKGRPKDWISVIMIVTVFSTLDIAQTVIMLHLLQQYYSRYLGNPETVLIATWEYSSIRVWNIPISCAAYAFYAFQLRMLSRGWVIPIVTVFLAAAQAGGTIVSAVGTFRVGTTHLAPLVGMASWGTVLGCSAACLCSTLIMLGSIFTVRMRANWDFPEGRAIRSFLRTAWIQINLPVVLISLVDLIAYILFPQTHVSTIAAMLAGKIWSNAMVYGLNLRGKWREAGQGAERDIVLRPMSPLVFASHPRPAVDEDGIEVIERSDISDSSTRSSKDIADMSNVDNISVSTAFDDRRHPDEVRASNMSNFTSVKAHRGRSPIG